MINVLSLQICKAVVSLPRKYCQSKRLSAFSMKLKRTLSKLFVTIILLPFAIFGILHLFFLWFYVSAPVYRFSEPEPFSGPNLINPYQDMHPDHWRKYNFQVQSKAWWGITDGRLNSNVLIDSMYSLLDYDYVATSDYQKINRHRENEALFIPTYEHGYSIRKTHQVCIGAEKVLWRDYIYIQTLSHKQHILDLLRPDNRIVALAHPLLLDGYLPEDLRYLSGYDLIEVLNNMRISTAHWDTALSNGHPAFILANDDAHDVSNSNEVGRRFTMINAANTERELILSSLEKGNAYGFDFFRVDDEPWPDKIDRSRSIPHLTSATLDSNRFTVSFSKPFSRLSFIGQHGRVLATANDYHTASYSIAPTDTYVRTEVMFYDSSAIYLNPVTRSQDGEPASGRLAEIDQRATLLFRAAIAGIGFLLIITVLFFIRLRKKKIRQ